MHFCRQPGRIGIPVKQIKWRRFLAQQVVTHVKRPDQVVGAQHVEGGSHFPAVVVAALGHGAFQAFELLLVNEHAQVTGNGEVYQRNEKGG